MSVRKGDRGEGKLQVLNKARELKRYSLERVKAFPKSTRWLYAAPIAEEVRAAWFGAERKNDALSAETGRKNASMTFHHNGIRKDRPQNEQKQTITTAAENAENLRKRKIRRLRSGNDKRISRFVACERFAREHVLRTAEND